MVGMDIRIEQAKESLIEYDQNNTDKPYHHHYHEYYRKFYQLY